MNKNIHIVYFTGTGGTALAANYLEEEFKKQSINTHKSQIFQDNKPKIKHNETLVLMYPVYSFDAPKPVFKWISSINESMNNKAIVISVSGGGEISPNTASRHRVIKRLKSKGFDVSNEYMLCMPSNFLTPTEENLAIKIIQILPIKCEEIVKDIVNNIRNKKRPFLIDKVMLSIAFFERIGAKIFGKLIKADGKCNSCGLCARECPVSNITMADNHPRFGWNCTICMHCLYNCPQDAIHARLFGSVVIKQGFDIKFYAKMAKEKAINDKIIITKNKHWSGVVKYLSDE